MEELTQEEKNFILYCLEKLMSRQTEIYNKEGLIYRIREEKSFEKLNELQISIENKLK